MGASLALAALALSVVAIPPRTSGARPAGAIAEAPSRPDPVQAPPDSVQARPDQAERTQTETTTPAGTPTIALLSQSSWVAPAGTFDLALDIAGASPTDRLDIAVFPRIASTAELDESLGHENLGRPLASDIHAFELTAYEATTTSTSTGSSTGIRTSIPVEPDTTPPFGIRLSQAGVYPVRIAVLDDDDNQLAVAVTHLIRLPPEGATTPLAVSLIVPVHAAPSHLPGGAIEMDPAALARIDAATAALRVHPTVPLTLVPTPETVDALAAVDTQTATTGGIGDPAATSRLTTFGEVAATRQILGRTYVDLDVGSWVAAPPPADASLNTQLVAGAQAIDVRIGVRPDTRTILADPTITPETLTRLVFTGTDQVVVPSGQLAPLSGTGPATSYSTFAVPDSTGHLVPAVSTDDSLVRRLTETADPVLNGHLVLADLAVTWGTSTEPRGAVLSVPADLDVPVETYDAVLDGLADRTAGGGGSPVVSPVTVDDLFRVTRTATVRSGETLVREYWAGPTLPLGDLPNRVEAARAHIASYRTMLRTDASRADDLDRQVLVSEAEGLGDEARDAYLSSVDGHIDAQFAAIVAPDDQRVTLTDERGELPITVESSLDYEVEVEVSITSVKLEFPEGDTRRVVLAPTSSTRVTVPVSSRASGAFPVEVSVRTPDDRLEITSTRFTVRSTAISGLGLVISISAGVFLLIWWGLHFRKTRRARRLVDSSHPSLR